MVEKSHLKACCLAASELSRAARAQFVDSLMRGVPASMALSLQGVGDGSLERAVKEIERHQAAGMGIVAFVDEEYPHTLRHLADPPLVLWTKGAGLSALQAIVCVSVVGSRKASVESCLLARQVGKYVGERGGCVVSGLAFGVDGEAHAAAIETAARVPTVAVLGHGLNEEIYPRAHRRLAERILERGGILLSHFAPEASPLPAHFVDRNRIIAGLSCLTVVIQAGERSGALVTARAATEAGRDVLVAPGAMTNASYVGSNRLIQSGAHILTALDDIRELVPGLARPMQESGGGVPLSQLAARLLKLIVEQGEQTHDHLLACAGCEAAQAALGLMELELAGLVAQAPGNTYIPTRAA